MLNHNIFMETFSESMILITYCCKQLNNTTGNDKLLTIPVIEKLCKFRSTILAGT